MLVNTWGHGPSTQPREKPTCGRCPKCHPGKNFGGDENCRALRDVRPWRRDCTCHRKESP